MQYINCSCDADRYYGTSDIRQDKKLLQNVHAISFNNKPGFSIAGL